MEIANFRWIIISSKGFYFLSLYKVCHHYILTLLIFSNFFHDNYPNIHEARKNNHNSLSSSGDKNFFWHSQQPVFGILCLLMNLPSM